MRAPTARMLPNKTTITLEAWVYGAAGGRQRTNNGPGPVLACSVQPMSAEDQLAHGREEGVTYHTVYYQADPLATIRSIINWVDYSPAKVLNVIGATRNVKGISGLFAVDCEERF